MEHTRRRTTLNERYTPCNCCNYPISHRHHLFEVAIYGESNFTRPLCPNCHELYHIVEDVNNSKTPSRRNIVLLNKLKATWGDNDTRLTYMVNLLKLVKDGKDQFEQDRKRILTFDILSGIFNLGGVPEEPDYSRPGLMKELKKNFK